MQVISSGTATLTHLPQCDLWIFARPNQPKSLFTKVLSMDMPPRGDDTFQWYQLQEITNSGKLRNYFNSPSCGICGHFGNEYFLLRRGPHVYYCSHSKTWKNVTAVPDYDMYMEASWRDGKDFINLYKDLTHTAVRRIQRWWQREMHGSCSGRR
jgi:hypothetical protein